MSSVRSLADWLATIEAIHPAEIELGLSRVKEVAVRLELLPFFCGQPSSGSKSSMPCPVITVAGTNGKGSTVTLIDSLLRAAGKKTGLYTSPHILRFNERIKLSGVEAEDQELVQAFEQIEQARGDISLTYFEYTTLAALLVFQARQVDVVILEVGLGGRLDAVNIVDAEVALITSIGLDHTDWLGESREQIALEKAGIARPGKPLLYGEIDRPASIDSAASDLGAHLLAAGEQFGVTGQTLFWQHQGQQQRLPLTADIPLGSDNLASAVPAISFLGWALPLDMIEPVAAATHLAGRCQRLALPKGEVILDIGHNAEALQRFLRLLPATTGRRFALCGMLSDKPAARTLAHFQQAIDGWYLASLAGPRGQQASVLAALLPTNEPLLGCYDSVREALQAALPKLQAQDQLLVFGSFYTVSEASEVLAEIVR